MPTLQDRLRLLRREPPAAAASVLAGALPDAETQEREDICRALLATGLPEAVATVIGLLHRAGPPVERLVREAPLSLSPAVSLVCRRGGRQAVLNAVDVVGERADVDLLPPLVGLLEGVEDDVAERAGETLVQVVVSHVGPDGRRPLDPAVARDIDDAVVAAVSSYPRHRRRDVLLAAAMLAARPGPGLRRILSDPDHPVLFPLRAAAARTGDPLVRGNMLRWLTHPALGGRIARRMHLIDGPDQFADLLRDGHLLLVPARRRAVRGAARPARCAPEPAAAMVLPSAVQLNLVRLISALRVRASLRSRLLIDAAGLPHPVARIHALLDLAGRHSPQADRAVDWLCFDTVEPVAWVASQHAFDRPGGPGAALLRRLERSGHRFIARRAAAAASSSGVAAFFERWLDLRGLDRLAAAMGLLATQRLSMLTRWAEILDKGGRQERLAAVALVRRLQLSATLEAELITAAADADTQVASAAVAALADGGSNRRIAAVRVALAHQDARVRANAVEALARLDRRATSVPGVLTHSRNNRVRANAIRALRCEQPEASRQGLRDMLADRDPLHRVSGVWVAGRTRDTRFLAQLRGLAARDQLPEVRTRAAAAARLLAHQEAAVNGAG
ncbi:MAG: HEAT repeat domain-containing protein [Planctomycetota bacterium]|jgi:HEAT repeat protein